MGEISTQILDLQSVPKMGESLSGKNFEIKEINGVPYIFKAYEFDPYMNVSGREYMEAYKLYRSRISSIYKVPCNFHLSITGEETGFIAQEQYVYGMGGHEIIKTRDIDATYKLARAVFAPLTSTLSAPVKLPIDYYTNKSPYPINPLIDTKADNFIIDHQGELVCIDFMPPRLRDHDGWEYPRKKIVSNRDLASATFRHGDLAAQIVRFFTQCAMTSTEHQPINGEYTDGLAKIYRQILLDCDPSHGLLQFSQRNLENRYVKEYTFGRHGPKYSDFYKLLAANLQA